jgi:hypothetical protein
MLCYHITPTKNIYAIRRGGLTPTAARGSLKCVWLATNLLLPWALDHVCQHHRLPESVMSIITLNVPREMLTRRRRGVWQCFYVIRPAHILQIRRCHASNQYLTR